MHKGVAAQRATDIRVRSREWCGVPLPGDVKKSGFQRALGCRKGLAAQLATCSDALGNWLARAAIVGGAFVLRVPPGALFLSDLVSKSISQLSQRVTLVSKSVS
jgi:hypothetical protein